MARAVVKGRRAGCTTSVRRDCAERECDRLNNNSAVHHTSGSGSMPRRDVTEGLLLCRPKVPVRDNPQSKGPVHPHGAAGHPPALCTAHLRCQWRLILLIPLNIFSGGFSSSYL